MPYRVVTNELTLNLRDDENREKTKIIQVNSIFTNTDQIADAHHDSMRGAVTDYIYRQKQAFDGNLDIGTEGDVHDKSYLVFLDERYDKVLYSMYDLHPDVFVEPTGSLARVVKDFSVLDAALAGTPEKGVANIISWILDGTIPIGSGRDILEYVEGYKAD